MCCYFPLLIREKDLLDLTQWIMLLNKSIISLKQSKLCINA